ncbi:MAG: hypothetical protein ACXVH7_00270 [Thermoanaerobaculia bacterium]
MKRYLGILTLLAAAATASADTIADIRAAVTSLHATTPARATLETQRFRKAEGRFANNLSAGDISVNVSVDAAGLQVSFPTELLDKAAREAFEHAADPKKPTPTQSALSEIDATNVAESLDFRAPLLRLLAIASVQTETKVLWHGIPAKLLVMKLTPKLWKEATSIWNVRFSEDRLNVWISSDNVPLAAERVQKGTAGFLFLRGEMASHESWTFAHVADRLVVARYENSFAGSGFGQRGEGRTVNVVTIR